MEALCDKERQIYLEVGSGFYCSIVFGESQ